MGELKNRPMVHSADAAMELTALSGNADSILHYMGLEIKRNCGTGIGGKQND